MLVDVEPRVPILQNKKLFDIQERHDRLIEKLGQPNVWSWDGLVLFSSYCVAGIHRGVRASIEGIGRFGSSSDDYPTTKSP